MKPLNSVIIKLTVCLIAGILLSYFLNNSVLYSLYSNAIGFVVLLISYKLAIRKFQKTAWYGFAVYAVMICLGVLTHTLHDQKNFSNHYTQLTNFKNTQTKAITFKIRERLKPSRYHDKYSIDIIQIDHQSVIGKALLNIEKDSLKAPYHIDDILMTYSGFQLVNTPLNPNQFDYKHYLEKQYIYHQVYSNHKSILTLKSQRHSLSGFAEALRQTINQKLIYYDFKPDELAIINALILGQRQDMDRGIYDNYVQAGAIHILAVSGLHVGIILLLLNFILKPIEQLKHGKGIKVLFILVLLWSFAIIAGLSASVTRAVTMFSILAIAMHLKRPTNIYNTLSVSIFILLLFKPMFLFDVGFQMSYLAVIAIVSIQPLLYKLWSPKWKITDYFWRLFTVTIAAQLGVVPISLYYFHQFPGLFLLSNLAIIPFLGLILGFGILVIFMALFDILPEVFANAYGHIISLMNTVVSWVSKQEQFLFKDISFNILQVLACYVLFISIVYVFKKRTFTRIAFVLTALLLIQFVSLYTRYSTTNSSFIIFQKSRYSLIGHKMNSELQIYHNFDSITTLNDKVVTNYSVGNFISQIESDSMQYVYQFQNNILLVIDSLAIYKVKGFQPDYVLLRNSPRLNLDRLIDSIHPKVIIADGSNYKTYIKRWEATCKKRKLPFHQTGKKGAFIIE